MERKDWSIKVELPPLHAAALRHHAFASGESVSALLAQWVEAGCPRSVEVVGAAWNIAPYGSPGFLYLMRRPDGLHKIGWSCDPYDRRTVLEALHKCSLEIVHLIPVPDVRQCEACAHEMFAVKRVKGEWFNLSPDEVSRFQKLTPSRLMSSSTNPDKRMLVFYANEEDVSRLRRIAKAVGCKTLSRALLYVIRLCSWIEDQIERGGRLTVVKSDGSAMEIVEPSWPRKVGV